MKQDVLPGRYTQLWFQATRPGTYHLFCAEYCGTLHSGMIGQVVAMEPADFQRWLAGGTAASPAVAGFYSVLTPPRAALFRSSRSRRSSPEPYTAPERRVAARAAPAGQRRRPTR